MTLFTEQKNQLKIHMAVQKTLNNHQAIPSKKSNVGNKGSQYPNSNKTTEL
jgi:hypothetical protein